MCGRWMRGYIPDVFKQSHQTIAELILQLSEGARNSLKAGYPMKELEYAWNAKLQELNYEYIPIPLEKA